MWHFEKLFPGEAFPSRADLLHWLPLRYSLALYSLAVKWTIAGGLSSAQLDKLRNDGIDMFYVGNTADTPSRSGPDKPAG